MNILCAANFSFVCVYNSESVLLYKTLDMVYHPDRSHTKHHVFCVNPNDTQLNFENSFISSGDCYTFLSFFAPYSTKKLNPFSASIESASHHDTSTRDAAANIWHAQKNEIWMTRQNLANIFATVYHRSSSLTSNRTYRMHLAQTKFFFSNRWDRILNRAVNDDCPWTSSWDTRRLFSSSTAKGTQQMFGKSPRGFMDFAHSKADDVFVVKSFKIEVLFFWDCKGGV